MGREKPMGRVSKVSCMSFGWRLCPFEGSQIPLLLLDGRDVPCRGTALQDQCCYRRNRSKSEHLQGSFTIETKGEEKETNTIQQYFAQDFIWTAFIIISKHSSLPLLHKWLKREGKSTLCAPWREVIKKQCNLMKLLLSRDHTQQKQFNQLMSHIWLTASNADPKTHSLSWVSRGALVIFCGKMCIAGWFGICTLFILIQRDLSSAISSSLWADPEACFQSLFFQRGMRELRSVEKWHIYI